MLLVCLWPFMVISSMPCSSSRRGRQPEHAFMKCRPGHGVFFVVPAYNESACVADVVTRLRAQHSRVLVVDDGSTDGTAAAAQAAGAVVLRHLINRGQGAALKTGIDYALAEGAEIIVTFDSDGQHQLEDVEGLIAPVREGRCNVALGSRFLNQETRVPLLRKVTLKLGVLFTRLVSRIKVTDTHNGLRDSVA